MEEIHGEHEFYQEGYKDGYEEGYRKGREDALFTLKQLLGKDEEN